MRLLCGHEVRPLKGSEPYIYLGEYPALQVPVVCPKCGHQFPLE